MHINIFYNFITNKKKIENFLFIYCYMILIIYNIKSFKNILITKIKLI